MALWSEWGRFDRAALEAPGSPDPNGVGAIRRLQTDGRTTRERITTCDAPTTLAYELIDGTAVRDYNAVVTLRPTTEGTIVAWSSRCRQTIPGTGGIRRRRLQDDICRILADLDAVR